MLILNLNMEINATKMLISACCILVWCSCYVSFEIPLLGDQTSISSIIPGGAHANHTADKAVDGDTDGQYWQGSCATTNINWEHWWMVNLTRSYQVSCVVIYRRTDCCSHWLEGAEASIGYDPDRSNNTVCGVVSLEQIRQGQRIEVNCNETLDGQYLVIKYGGLSRAYFQICEVQAYATPCGVQTTIQSINASTAPQLPASTESEPTSANTIDSSTTISPYTRKVGSDNTLYISKVLFIVVILATVAVTAFIVLFFVAISKICRQKRDSPKKPCTCGQHIHQTQPGAAIPLDNDGYTPYLNNNTLSRYEELRPSNVTRAAISTSGIEPSNVQRAGISTSGMEPQGVPRATISTSGIAPQGSSVRNDDDEGYELPESVTNDYASIDSRVTYY